MFDNLYLRSWPSPIEFVDIFPYRPPCYRRGSDDCHTGVDHDPETPSIRGKSDQHHSLPFAIHATTQAYEVPS
tara:strand:+ start:286 stop:504 length:219 start_codon:yes stop_codon:yes gene_type:complete